ncbi:MAG: Gfo/Idh/MocA family oxidoreductase [Verrucomicrobiae bacterium]|nr:Gfo/Idh/MocA family oxidoreductase [Verrucomicrobiae bacterium]
METKAVRFGIIGCGLMGREFASAVARWCHLTEMNVRPEIVATCSRSPASHSWFKQHFPSLQQTTADYRALLMNPDVDAVYVALPHHLHQVVYCAVIEAGKHLMGEKPFGINREACEAIVACMRQHPEVFVRCSSQFAFYPAVQRIGALIEANALGRIIEVNTGFLHSSDLDPDKPINWKRMTAFNGEYGVMGDLGMHACHVPLRAGWRPRNVRAILSNIVQDRPDGKGNRVPCETWDNATLLCETSDPQTGQSFPWSLKTHRIAPGQKNNWYVEILGTKTSVRWSSANADTLELMEYQGGEQSWRQIPMGHETAYQTITGGIFQFGFTDAILQMWAAFLREFAERRLPSKYSGCVTPEEVLWSHRLFTAALESQRNAATVAVSCQPMP